MPNVEREQSVQEILKKLHGIDSLKKLFWSELNYNRVNKPLSRRDWSQTAANCLKEDPVLFAGGGQNDDFHVIYSRLPQDKLSIGQERPVVNQLLKDHPYSLFIFSNQAEDKWHFINVKNDADNTKRRMFRRISVSPEDRLRTAAERITMLDLHYLAPDMFGLKPLTIQSKHDEAFDVEKVTTQFFFEYETQFRSLEKELRSQTKDHTWAHDYSLQFLNRSMFIYFIQRKGWLGGDRDFLLNYWKAYQHAGQPLNSFVDNWLNVLFFEAFNNKFHGGHTYFPPAIRDTLSLAPYLNGGLFTANSFDTDYKAKITDSHFERILKFLERYNFTISEDSPLDKEVAVDPEMIGKVYESLVNVSDEVDERGEAGIFYTPRTEIDLMCRLTVVDNLANYVGENKKALLYQLVFALEPDEKMEADKAVATDGLWPAIDERLHAMTILDPACGSGSFLVGMLNILDDLQERANRHLNKTEAPYERKKRIIGQSLYGVDVMGWACHTAELRLWLSLIIDAEIPQAELHVRKEPLLPHFTFKIRYGDSLVQEIGGVNFGHKHESMGLSKELKKRIDGLKIEKLKFYNNDKTCRFHSLEEVKQEERNIFMDLLEYRIVSLENEITMLTQRIQTPHTQLGMLGLPQKPTQAPLEVENWKRERDQKQEEIAEAENALTALNNSLQIPFVWDIAFVEIFESEKDGFDIVIGNPPYVERHKIRDPAGLSDAGISERKVYMGKLAMSIYKAFPTYFGLRPTGSVSKTVTAMSDLYVYFYFYGLSLLNQRGSFCFITSNSWLDVGYGANLQEFLLKHCHIKLVLDNQVRRTFTNADVNSIIVLFSSPDDGSDWALEKTARFIMFRVPFENILSPVIFEEIEEASERKLTKEYRVFPVTQSELLADGCEITQEEKIFNQVGSLIEVPRYLGNKWGGKYLRAPDIYHLIKEKGFMVPVRLHATARLGITTGANDFFFIKKLSADMYLTKIGDTEREIPFPDSFTRPVIRTVTECNEITFKSTYTPWRIIVLPEVIHDKRANDYVKLAERLGISDQPFFRGRKHWFSYSSLPDEIIAVPEIVFARYFFLWNEDKSVLNKNFYGFSPKGISPALLWGLLNSSFSFLQFELSSRKPGAGASGISVDVANRMLVLSVDRMNADDKKKLELAGEKLRRMPIRDIHIDLLSQERRGIDNIIYDLLGLTQGEREAVYEALINLVEARLKKADSLEKKT